MSFVIYQPDRVWLKKLIKELGPSIKGRMLDIGAGETDRYAKYFNYTQRQTTDIKAGKNVDVVASADNLPFADLEFDSVVCTQVLEHVARPLLVIREMSRILKQGGYALISVPLTAELHEEPHDYWRYTRYGVESLLKENGFEVVENKQEGGYYSMLANIKIRHLINKYRLYDKFILGRLLSRLFRIYGSIMIWLDHNNLNEADRRHTLGYVVLAKKI